MYINNVQSVIDQRYGFSRIQEADNVLYRLHYKADFAEYVSNFFNSPIFACKSALKHGYEHFVAMATEDGKLIVMDCDNKDRHVVDSHNNAIFDLAWMFDQMKIVTASGDHTSKMYDFGDGDIRKVRMFCGHTRSVKSIAFRKEDSSVFATGSRDGNINLWDTRIEQNSFIGRPDRTIVNSHSGKDPNTPSKPKRKNHLCANSAIKSVTGLVFQDYNTLISCGAGDGIIKIWDLRKHYTVNKKDPLPKYTIPYSGTTGKRGFSNLAIDSGGVKLYANCLDNTIYCYNVATYNNEPVMKYRGHQNSTFYIKASLSKDDKYLISGSSDEHAFIWNLRYPEPIVKLVGHTAEVTCVAWCNSRGTPSLITCSDDLTHHVWTIFGEDCPDNLLGKAEPLPHPSKSNILRKRIQNNDTVDITPKKFIWQCPNCRTAVDSYRLCENCITTSLKRKADTELTHDFKRVSTEFGPRRLFAHLSTNVEDVDSFLPLDGKDKDTINLESLGKECDSIKESISENSDPTKSPTVNLPNFVVDGTAPHLNISPPQRKTRDWLTKMRIERNLRQELLERTMGPQSPKIPKLETTPKSSKKTGSSSKSPLLRFFKVKNNKSDNLSCSSKSHTCNYFSTNSCEQLSQ